MGEKKKSEVRNWLNFLQLEKFNKLNFSNDIEEINLLVDRRIVEDIIIGEWTGGEDEQ